MSLDSEESIETALVEVSPGTALVFGQAPEGFDLIPFRLVSPEDQVAIGAAIAETSAILNVGGQLASGLAQAQGLVRLAPQTLRALKAGLTPIQSGGYNIGVLAGQNGKFAGPGPLASRGRWCPGPRGAREPRSGRRDDRHPGATERDLGAYPAELGADRDRAQDRQERTVGGALGS